MVKTEFVWADGAEHDVKLSGAWNGWMPVQVSSLVLVLRRELSDL